jgi:hypothetical protein
LGSSKLNVVDWHVGFWLYDPTCAFEWLISLEEV